MNIHPAFAIVLITVFVIAIFTGVPLFLSDFGSFLTILKWLAILFGGGWVLNKLFPQVQAQPNRLLNPRAHTHLENGWMEDRGQTKILHADGYQFEMANIRGRLHWRELDPYNGKPTENWVSANVRDTREEQKVMAEHITWRVNGRKGL